MSKKENNNHTPTTATAAAPPTNSELDRLRDILYGDHARDVTVQIDELRAQLARMGESQGSRIDDVQSDLQGRLADLEATLAISRQNLDNDIRALNERLDTQKATQQEMAKLLMKIGSLFAD